MYPPNYRVNIEYECCFTCESYIHSGPGCEKYDKYLYDGEEEIDFKTSVIGKCDSYKKDKFGT